MHVADRHDDPTMSVTNPCWSLLIAGLPRLVPLWWASLQPPPDRAWCRRLGAGPRRIDPSVASTLRALVRHRDGKTTAVPAILACHHDALVVVAVPWAESVVAYIAPDAILRSKAVSNPPRKQSRSPKAAPNPRHPNNKIPSENVF